MFSHSTSHHTSPYRQDPSTFLVFEPLRPPHPAEVAFDGENPSDSDRAWQVDLDGRDDAPIPSLQSSSSPSAQSASTLLRQAALKPRETEASSALDNLTKRTLVSSDSSTLSLFDSSLSPLGSIEEDRTSSLGSTFNCIESATSCDYPSVTSHESWRTFASFDLKGPRPHQLAQNASQTSRSAKPSFHHEPSHKRHERRAKPQPFRLTTNRLSLPPPIPLFLKPQYQPNLALALEALPCPPRRTPALIPWRAPPRIHGWIPPEERPLPPKTDAGISRPMERTQTFETIGESMFEGEESSRSLEVETFCWRDGTVAQGWSSGEFLLDHDPTQRIISPTQQVISPTKQIISPTEQSIETASPQEGWTPLTSVPDFMMDWQEAPKNEQAEPFPSQSSAIEEHGAKRRKVSRVYLTRRVDELAMFNR